MSLPINFDQFNIQSQFPTNDVWRQRASGGVHVEFHWFLSFSVQARGIASASVEFLYHFA